jgi:hypothetical protein
MVARWQPTVPPHIVQALRFFARDNLLQRQRRDGMAVLFKDLSHAGQYPLLFRLLGCVTQKDAALGERGEQVLDRSFQGQHTGGDNRDILKRGGAKRFWGMRQSIPVRPSISPSHAKVVCSMIFLASCLPKWT